MGIALLTDVTYADASLPINFADLVIEPTYTRYVLDALDAVSWPKQVAPAIGDHWTDLSPHAADAVFDGAAVPGFAGGGFAFSATAGERITLPPAAKIAPTSRGYVVVLWIKVPPAQAQNQRVGGFHRNFTGPWAIATYDGGNNYFIVADTFGNAAPLAAGVHQIAMVRCEDGAGGFFARHYIDGVLAGSVAGGAQVAQPPADVTRASLGDDVDMSYLPETWAGGIYRHWLWDVGTDAGVATAAKVDALVATDWADNRARTWG